MTFAELLKRAWIPVVVLAVVGGAMFAVERIRTASGDDRYTPYGKSEVAGMAQMSRKTVVYEIFGAAGTVADISYLDVNSEPRRVEQARLPWSLQFTTDSAAVVGNVVAQGDSDNLGCRISVNGQVKAERISHEVSAFTFCRVGGA